jgi:hypothetical protein
MLTPRQLTPPTPAAESQAPALSPAHVKDAIAAVSASRRKLLDRISNLALFAETQALDGDPIEVQLLFAARDNYLTAATAAERNQCLSLLMHLVKNIRLETGTGSSEMVRLLTTAMITELGQKKIDATIRIAQTKVTRNAAPPTLAEMMAEDAADAADALGKILPTEDDMPIVIEDPAPGVDDMPVVSLP